MSKVIVFDTPGLMPIEAFTMVGLNAKPKSTNPIGFFGTGLKYAIAVLLRLEQKVTIFIGRTEYVFETRREEFREKEFQFVYMRKREGVLSRWRTVKLPFTLEYGKTWEMWQAYRELHTNTLDENGEILDYHSTEVPLLIRTGHTLIIVEGEEFRQAYYDRFKTFLPEGLGERNSTDTIQVLNKPSRHMYYRGMRVFDFPEKVESLFTYNFLGRIDLTEDRTAKYPFMLEMQIAEMYSRSEDKELIKAMYTAPVGSFERKINFRYVNTPPSSSFRTISSRSYASYHSGRSYLRSHIALPKYKYAVRDIVQAYIDLCRAHDISNDMVDEAKRRLAEEDDEIIF